MDMRYVVGTIAGLVMAWFALGIIFNLRRGDAILRWMQGGLPKLGERTSLRWLGSSVAELVIERAKAPFRRVTTLIVLAPRDVPWMWLWSLFVGRRDTLIFRCQLATSPKAALELADPASWTGRQGLNDAAREGWDSQTYAPAHPAAASNSGVTLQLMAPHGMLNRALEALPSYTSALEGLSPGYSRLSVRRDVPTLEVHLPLPNPRRADATEYFEALRVLATVVEGQ